MAAVALGPFRSPDPGSFVVAAAAAVGWLGFSARNLPRAALACLLLAAVAWGTQVGARAEARAERAVAGWLPTDGTPVELCVVGRVLRAPERCDDGARWLLVEGRPERDPRPRAEAATIRLALYAEAPGRRDHVDALRRGDRIRVWARVRRTRVLTPSADPAPGRAAAAQGLDATGSLKSPRLIERIAEGGPSVGRAIDLALARLRAGLDAALGSSGANRAVVGAMVLGDRAALDRDAVRLLRDAGLWHLVAISGLNVGMMVLAGLALLRRAGAGVTMLAVAGAPALAGFALLVGGSPPVARACAAAGVIAIAGAVGRRGGPLNTLAIVGAALTAVEPRWLHNAGFHLSMAATAGILVLGAPMARLLPLPRPLARAAATSLAAHVATAPILAVAFGRLAPAAIVTNLAAVPVSALILFGGTTAALAADVPFVGPLAGRVAAAGVELLVAVARAGSELPPGALRVASPGGVVAGLCGLLVALETTGLRTRQAPVRRAVAALLLGVLHVGPPPPHGRWPIEVTVLDVGQGQAVVVRGPSGVCALVDAGGSAFDRFDAGDRVVVPFLVASGCRRVALAAATHAHDDHSGGFDTVLRDLEVGALWLGAGSVADDGARRLLDLAHRAGVPVVLARRGTRAVDDGIELSVVHPDAEDRTLPINERCLAIRIANGAGLSILIPGDLGAEGERRVLARGARVESTALVAGHHGARSSSSAAWLDAVRPRIAIISAAHGNRFGHPAEDTLDRLTARRAAVVRTDLDGTVILRAEGSAWRWVTARPRTPRVPE